MDDNRLIQNLKTLPLYNSAIEKLTISPNQLNENEKTFLLTVALILLRKYERDHRLTTFVELAYYIILKYSLFFKDYDPLYDFSVNIGYYPIAQAITDLKEIQFNSISSSLIPTLIDDGFKKDSIIETYEQKHTRNEVLKSDSKDICYIAPTSFGKSSIISEHITANWDNAKRVAVIVPTKSLLMQTYRAIRKKKLDTKIIIHDEMYNNEDRFIAILTQERALRLLDKHSIFFDCMYIDEAHRLFDRDSRAILLSRLIKLNRQRNKDPKIIYLSPLVTNTSNLIIDKSQIIFEQRIRFNIKEPEYFEYSKNEVFKYNRFINKFFHIGISGNMFDYIIQNATEKSFCYLYAPRKIEQFAEKLSKVVNTIKESEQLREVIRNLKKYVHDEFYVIDYLRKGIIYLHGKMPDNVKEYLECKYSEIPDLQFIIANKVILEGINLPISSLFILNGTNLYGKDLINLIGRVNRLDQVFTQSPRLDLLMPKVHFVNSDEYNRKNGNFENKIQILQSSVFEDKVKNPILDNFNWDDAAKKNDNDEKCKEIVKNEELFFSDSNGPIQELKRKMIALGMNNIYTITDELCQTILGKIDRIKNHPKLHEGHFLERLRYLFIRHCDGSIVDDEFARLKNDKAIAYYKMFFNNRKKSLKENIAREVAYFKRRISEGDSLMYIGESYGEQPYTLTGRNSYHNVYVDLSRKTNRQLVNIAIVKQKVEEDFVCFKLRMFFQLMLDYFILSEDEYYEIIYGTTDRKKIHLVKTGLTINLINRLENDDQLKNINIDKNGNLVTNHKFDTYLKDADDFYRFELNRIL